MTPWLPGDRHAVQVLLADGAGFGGDAEGDVLIKIENVIGSAFGDNLVGDDSNVGNLLSGRGGDDSISGLGGRDHLYGGGSDFLDGGNGNDWIYAGSEDDALFGGAGANFLYGDTGDDDLDGGQGLDRYTGGAGSDIFTLADGDRVLDFENGQDLLRIDPNLSLAYDNLVIQQVGGDVEIHYLEINSQTGGAMRYLGLLEGVSLDQIGEEDFIF